jgi:hypothetical protein
MEQFIHNDLDIILIDSLIDTLGREQTKNCGETYTWHGLSGLATAPHLSGNFSKNM